MKKIIILSTTICLLFSEAVVVHAQTNDTTPTLTPTSALTPTPLVTPSGTENKLLQQAQQKQQNQQERLIKIKQAADKYIQERIASINKIIAYANSTKVGSSSTVQTTVSDLQSDIQGLESLQTQIDAITDPSQISSLMPLVEKIFQTYRIYEVEIPKLHAAVHLTIVENSYTKYLSVAQNMNDDITYAQSQNKDVTKLQADYSNFNTDVAKLNNDIQYATTISNAYTPQSYDSSKQPPSQVLSPQFQLLHQDIENINADYKQFATDFRTLFGLK